MPTTSSLSPGLDGFLANVQPEKRVIFVSGSFNVVHSGHVRLLNFAAECGEILIVGLHKDGEPGSVIPQELRLEAVSAISVVDQAFIMEESLTEIIKKIRPDMIIKGKEHEDQINIEQSALEQCGGKLIFANDDSRFSAIENIQSNFKISYPTEKPKIGNYLTRRQISQRRNNEILKSLSELQVLVVGDLIADEYTTCKALGMSQEDPTIVVSPIASEMFIGGAGIVSAHAAGLGANARLVSITGVDETAIFVEDKLKSFGVEAYLIPDETRPTTLKKRYRSQGKTLLRVNEFRQHEISKSLASKLLERVTSLLDRTQLVLFSDFSYGSLPQPLVDQIIKLCNKNGVMMAADSQSSSQFGNIGRFSGMQLVTPTEREARLAIGNHSAGLVQLASELQNKSDAENILMTLGSEGIFIQTKTRNDVNGLITDKLPALNDNPLDVAGAGDSLFVTSAMALAAGATIWEAALIGSQAAAAQVARLGNIPINREDIINEGFE